MTEPSLEQLRASVPPLIRDYIDASIEAAVAAHSHPTTEPAGYRAVVSKVEELSTLVADLMRRYQTDDRFAITRAKIVHWMQKTGID